MEILCRNHYQLQYFGEQSLDSMHLLYLFFSEFFSLSSWCYYPELQQVQNYLHRKVRKKRKVEIHSKIIKLIYHYTHIILNSYANFHSDRTIIHKYKSILLLDHYSGLIYSICGYSQVQKVTGHLGLEALAEWISIFFGGCQDNIKCGRFPNFNNI